MRPPGVHSVPHDLNRPASADVVKVVKCQVDGIAVDISANALGGLCTLVSSAASLRVCSALPGADASGAVSA